jgi:uncharacterized membrane protein
MPLPGAARRRYAGRERGTSERWTMARGAAASHPQRRKSMAKTIVGSFDNFDEAQRVSRELMDEGFAAADMSVVASNVKGEFAIDDRVKVTDASNTATGAVAGGVLGGAAGLAASLMGLAIPGIGPIVAAGPLAAALSGAGAGVIAGGLIGSLTELGVSKPDAEYYAEAVRRGGALVTVRTGDEAADRVVEIMHEHGAIDIDRRAAAWRERGWSGFDPAATPYTTADIERDRALYGAPEQPLDTLGATRAEPPRDMRDFPPREDRR